jgi:hypothetical protein
MTVSSPDEIKMVPRPVSDLNETKAVHTALVGLHPQAHWSYYAGFEAAGPSPLSPIPVPTASNSDRNGIPLTHDGEVPRNG